MKPQAMENVVKSKLLLTATGTQAHWGLSEEPLEDSFRQRLSVIYSLSL
jgi:hypothetical protein